MKPILAAAFSVAAVWLTTGPRLEAQTSQCTAVQLPTSRASGTRLPSGESNTFVGGGIVLHCPTKKITLKADSAEIYGDEGRVYFVGNVNYAEPRMRLTSDFLTYTQRDERVVATGNVHALSKGSTLAGPEAEYLRVALKIRTRARMTATGRPTIGIVQTDADGHPVDVPTMVTANTTVMDGDSLFYGSGQVQITRTEYGAAADSVFIDSGKETIRLMRSPSVEGKRSRPFKLTGTLIDMYSHQRKLQRVLAKGDAVATSQDLTLKADTIDLRVTADLLQRAFAWGPSRAHATSPTENIIADSLDVQMPNQKARQVRAFRKAYAEGKPDTVKFRTSEKDWMRGDTIYAFFDTMPPKDTTKGPVIRQILALGSASSFYHLPPKDSSLCLPAINYVLGQRITVDFDSSRIGLVQVDDKAGKVAGVYIDPVDSTREQCKKPRAATKTDSAARADSLARPARPKPGGGGPDYRGDTALGLRRPETLSP